MDSSGLAGRRLTFGRTDYAELRVLLDRSAQLVEVLPAEEYAEEYLPGAINTGVHAAVEEVVDLGDGVVLELALARPGSGSVSERYRLSFT